MNLEAVLNDLYYQLEVAQSYLRDARNQYHSCQLNTPGRCSAEADRLARAEAKVRRLERELQQVGADVEPA